MLLPLLRHRFGLRGLGVLLLAPQRLLGALLRSARLCLLRFRGGYQPWALLAHGRRGCASVVLLPLSLCRRLSSGCVSTVRSRDVACCRCCRLLHTSSLGLLAGCCGCSKLAIAVWSPAAGWLHLLR